MLYEKSRIVSFDFSIIRFILFVPEIPSLTLKLTETKFCKDDTRTDFHHEGSPAQKVNA